MVNLYHAATRLLGSIRHFKHESRLEGFVVGHPRVLSQSDNTPDGLLPTYIISRQEAVRLVGESARGITDLICLIWDPNIAKYRVWIYELKIHSTGSMDVDQLTRYLDAFRDEANEMRRQDVLQRAQVWVGSEYLETSQPFGGAILAQSFSEEVIKKIIEANEERDPAEKIVALKLNRFPVQDEFYVVVETLFSPEDRTQSGGRSTYYDDIPALPDNELESALERIVVGRRKMHHERFRHLCLFLSLFVEDPDRMVTKNQCQDAWEKHGLPTADRGLSVSQVLGYRDNGALRQILRWEWVYSDLKDNYRLRDPRYAAIVGSVLAKVQS